MGYISYGDNHHAKHTNRYDDAIKAGNIAVLVY